MKSLDKIVNGIVRRVERATGYKVKQVSGGGHSLGRRFTKSELLVIGNKLKQAGFLKCLLLMRSFLKQMISISRLICTAF